MWVASNITIKARRIGDVVHVKGESWGVSSISTDWTDVTVVPSGMAPSAAVYFAGARLATEDGNAISGRVLPDGHLWLMAPNVGGCSYWGFTATYVLG